jgi:hypothetical protein
MTYLDSDPIFNPSTLLLVAEVGDFEAGQQAAIHGLFLPIFSLAPWKEFLPGSVAKHLLPMVA